MSAAARMRTSASSSRISGTAIAIDAQLSRTADLVQTKRPHRLRHSWKVTMNFTAAGWTKSASVGMLARNGVLFGPE